MNVYRDIGGKPDLVGECDLKLPPEGAILRKIPGPLRVQNQLPVDDPMREQNARLVRDEWEIGPIQEYGIMLRATDNPEHLPGWKPLTDWPPFRYEAGRITETDDPELLPGWKPLKPRGESAAYAIPMPKTPMPYAAWSEVPPVAPRRSLREMAQSAAKTFALQLPPEPLSFGRERFAEYMAGVIEALLLTAARGEYQPAGSPEAVPICPPGETLEMVCSACGGELVDGECIGIPPGVPFPPGYIDPRGFPGYPCGIMEHCHPTPHEALECQRKPIEEALQGLEAPDRPWHSHIRIAEPAVSVETRAAMYRAAGLDHDGEPVPLPKKPEPEERPFIPNKFGEHGDD